MQVYYINHKNQKIDFMDGNYNIEDSSFFAHLWSYESKEASGYGGRIEQFKKGIQEKSIVVHVTSIGLVSCETAYQKLMETMECDVLNKIPGHLYVNGSYLRCYFIQSTPKYFVPGIGSISCEFKIAAEYPFWITEKSFEFRLQTAEEPAEDAKVYPYTYDYTYPVEITPQYIDNDHYFEADFRMIVFGPRASTYITIGGNIYHVDYELSASEYMVIDSRKSQKEGERVYLVKSNGEKVNLFDYRDPSYSILARIPIGKSRIDIGGAGVDITLFQERSVPHKWN